MATKTNAVRLLQQAGIALREAFYEFDEQDLSGTHAADAMGMPHEQVFKTLVTRGERTGIHVFCIPVCCELDLKKAASAAGVKSIEMIPSKTLLPTTGYVHGGCSPVGMKKVFPTFIDETAQLYDYICVSAGAIGTNIAVNPDQLCEFVPAQYADITK